MQIITRNEAIAKGQKTYFGGTPCKYGNLAERRVNGRGCLCDQCLNDKVAAAQQYRKLNPEKVKAYQQSHAPEYYKRNAERIRERNSAYHEKNRDKKLAQMKAYYKANRDEMIAKSSLYSKQNREACNLHKRKWYSQNKAKHRLSVIKWTDKNRERVNSYNRNWWKARPDRLTERWGARRARKLLATPKWLTENHWLEIRAYYQLSNKLFNETGIKHHVDHIIPLRGATVCGLHVPWNLQVIPANDNLRKSNRLIAV
jgi:hypothetical protein